eukprot:8516781-Alexandrium_andersonii.AAC.1
MVFHSCSWLTPELGPARRMVRTAASAARTRPRSEAPWLGCQAPEASGAGTCAMGPPPFRRFRGRGKGGPIGTFGPAGTAFASRAGGQIS